MENQETMLGRLMSVLLSVPVHMLGTLVDLARKLSGKEGEKTHELLKKLLRGEVKIVRTKILEFIGTVKTSVTTERFVAKQKFVKDSKEIRFYEILDNFTSWFLPGDGKIEEPVGEQMLSYGKLTKDSVDGPIIEELGGEAKVETILSTIYGLLLKQPNGEKKGVLLANGYANIFYVKDINGVLRAVGVFWDGDGWSVSARSVEDPDGWYAGRRVFYRNSWFFVP